MSEFEELLTKTAEVLERLKIPYMVTGGAGVVFWGKPRFTADIDIVVELRIDDITPLARELRRVLGDTAYIDEAMMRTEQGRRGEFNIIHPESGLKVDFFVIGNDAFARAQLQRRVRKTIAGQEVSFISPEDLILSKLRWYRESDSMKHLDDARSVVRIQGERLDRAHLRQWAERLGVADSLVQILEA